MEVVEAAIGTQNLHDYFEDLFVPDTSVDPDDEEDEDEWNLTLEQ